MKLYLAVAVLVLAFVAYSEAQDQTLEDKLGKIGEHIGDITRNIAEKAKSTFESIHNSPFGQNTRNWFQEQIEKIKSIGKGSQ